MLNLKTKLSLLKKDLVSPLNVINHILNEIKIETFNSDKKDLENAHEAIRNGCQCALDALLAFLKERERIEDDQPFIKINREEGFLLDKLIGCHLNQHEVLLDTNKLENIQKKLNTK